MTEFRIRWPIVAIESLFVPLIAGAFVAVVVRPIGLGIGLGVGGVLVIGAIRCLRVRRRRLQVSAEGLFVQRDKYALRVAWDSATEIRHRTMLFGLIPVEDLVFAESAVIARNSRGKTGPIPRQLADHPGLTRIQINFYDKRWRSGPVGDQLRFRGIAE